LNSQSLLFQKDKEYLIEKYNNEKQRAGELKEQINTLKNRETALIMENKLLIKQSTDTQRTK
tara:strand:+ start:658 stop:843 length:186 start_codon:yes stop_codon:yes gene_type:complete